MLQIQNLTVSIDKKKVVDDLSLAIPQGELHVLMGPNGSGKSSLAHALAGHPSYEVIFGSVMLDGEELLAKKPEERSLLGLFVAFQKPVSIPGVPAHTFLRTVARAHSTTFSPATFRKELAHTFSRMGLAESMKDRELHVGLSGGESKRMELVQLSILGAKIAILDEPDSGLDLDGFRMVASEIERQQKTGTGILLITHNPKILRVLTPTAVHVMTAGRLVASGTEKLVTKLEAEGFSYFTRV